LGKLHYFLGLEVTHSDHSLVLTQKKYYLDLLRRASMLDCRTTTIPMSSTDRLSVFEGVLLSSDDATEYRNIIGGLQYLAYTIPDISYVVNRVCQFLQTPRDTHWSAVKRIMCYLWYTAASVLHLHSAPFGMLSAIYDADSAGSPDDRRSTGDMFSTLVVT
jgi:histone deacetylase 1/2